MAYVFCNQYNRFNWVQVYRILKGKTVNGRLFPWRDIYECSDDLEFMRQFPIEKKLSGGLYQQLALNKKHILRHKFLVENILRETIEKPFTVDHINNDPFDNRIENLQILFQWEQVEKSSKYKRGYSYHKATKKYRTSFQGKDLGLFMSDEEALKARELAKKAWKIKNADLVNKKNEYNDKIKNYIRNKYKTT